jgi:hypothetical protein
MSKPKVEFFSPEDFPYDSRAFEDNQHASACAGVMDAVFASARGTAFADLDDGLVFAVCDSNKSSIRAYRVAEHAEEQGSARYTFDTAWVHGTGSQGQADTELYYPQAICSVAGPDGAKYFVITDGANHRIKLLDAQTGALVRMAQVGEGSGGNLDTWCWSVGAFDDTFEAVVIRQAARALVMDLSDMSVTESAKIWGTNNSCVAADRGGSFVWQTGKSGESLQIYTRSQMTTPASPITGPSGGNEMVKLGEPLDWAAEEFLPPVQDNVSIHGCAIDHGRGRLWVSLSTGFVLGWGMSMVKSAGKR